MNYDQDEQFVVEAVDVAGIDVLEEDIAPAKCNGGNCCNEK
jgi:hypothetical protein